MASMDKKKAASAASMAVDWVRRRSRKKKILLGTACAVLVIVLVILSLLHPGNFFVASEAAHFAGIFILIRKLTLQKTCSGVSLKTQEITAIFLGVRLICSFVIEGDIYTILDFATFVSTLLVIYTIRHKLKTTYVGELDNFPIYCILLPSALLSMFINPDTRHTFITRIMWAFCVYTESVSVLPQLRFMQNAKMIEPLTAQYVFALGVPRFFSCAYWTIQVYRTGGRYLYLIGSGYMWLPVAMMAEIVQTFILADFCYYYILSVLEGQLVLKMPV